MQLKRKQCSGCDSLQFIWKSLGKEKFCRSCWAKHPKSKAKAKPAKKQFIAPFSDKKSKENAAYSALRKVYLLQHPLCAGKIPDVCTTVATTCHHKRGRGKYLLQTDTWVQLCMGCHDFVERNVEYAYEHGLSEPRLKNYDDGK
jgi:hypothetical protein